MNKAQKKSLVGIIVIVMIAISAAYFQLFKRAQRLGFGIDSIKPNFKTSDIISIIAGGGSIPTTVTALIKNFSPATFTIKQMQLDIFSEDGKQSFGSQTLPLSAKKTVDPNSNTPIELKYNINPIAFLDSEGKKLSIQDLAKWFTGQQIGVKLLLKGFVVAEGFKVNINEVITI
jgi:hypothetical protein